VLKAVLRPSANVASAGVSSPFLSAVEDVVAVVGGVVAVLVPLVPIVFVAFLLFFFYRIRRRRGRKFGGLRILGD
jgi:Fe2+ transport system protein B